MYSHVKQVDEIMKPGWNNLGVVETIFEDEDEDEDLDSLSSSPLSFPLLSPSSPLQSGIDAWTAATGRQPDVKIHVRGICFHLHKDLLMSKSSYFKRQLTKVSEYTLSPPLKVAADIFKQVADFCYNNHAVVMPSNAAALRTAADLLEMDGDSDGSESLREITESYLCNVLLHNREFTITVFRASLTLLPEAEQTACIVSRCLEALFMSVYDEDGDGAVSCADGLKTVSPENFEVIADSMQRRFTRSHDLLYRVVDLYFLVYNGKIMSEDQRTQITRCIDCSILSEPLLMHAVQNPRMPLRFVVQAMLIEQLNTHRSIFTALNNTPTAAKVTDSRPHHEYPPDQSPATLGAILERDAALRQVAQMRTAIDSTSSRIQTLEKELSNMKKLLGEKRKEKKEETSMLLLEDGRRTESCRFSSNGISTDNTGSNHKVDRGERGSISSSMVRLFGGDNVNTSLPKHRTVGSSSSSSWCLQSDYQSPKANMKRNFGQKLITGLRNVFGVSDKLKKGGKSGGGDDKKVIGYDKEEITFDSFAINNALPHHRSQSAS